MNRLALDAELTTEVGDADGRFQVTARLRLESGVLVMFGPSGAGKSITLRSLAGLHRPRRGWIRLGDQVLFDAQAGIDVPAHRRQLGYVPQHDTLFPFCDVAANVAFGLPRGERKVAAERVRALLSQLGISHLEHAAPRALSGGERQRVALARALILRPRLLLLDEPFAAIDEDGRQSLRAALRRVLEETGTSAVLVTHDPLDATVLGDQLVRFERGRTTVQGEPESMLRPAGPPLLWAVRTQGRASGA